MTLLWDSKKNGTYKKAEHGSIGKEYISNSNKKRMKRQLDEVTKNVDEVKDFTGIKTL